MNASYPDYGQVTVPELDGAPYPRVSLRGNPGPIDWEINALASVRGIGTEYKIYTAYEGHREISNGRQVIVTLDADGPYPSKLLAWVLPDYETALRVITAAVLHEIADETA